ncbi:MAG: aminotransferase class V-fold PLP-dependent enzyme, partial [Actinobacteria bacterium]|nr:aminotransferase class V-fold PLP-dependent enzyme [Actinomycetota bacterium]
AGADGPVPRRAAEAVSATVAEEAAGGRGLRSAFDTRKAAAARLRDGYAGLLGCSVDDVALTHSTTDGVNTVLSGLALRPGDELLTTDEEHPGLLAPLATARVRHGVEVRVVPWEELAGAVGPRTRLVACSHVSWATGKVVDAAGLRAAGASVLLDGAQGLGAVPADVGALGCDYYAAAGQKWLCGPDGTGVLYVAPERRAEVALAWPSYSSLSEPGRPLELLLHPGSARYEAGFIGAADAAWALAALDVLGEAGWPWVLDRAATLAAALAAGLRDRGVDVLDRGTSTLVSWRVPDPEAAVEELAAHGFAVRSIPSAGVVRASVGAWNSEDELDRLAALA